MNMINRNSAEALIPEQVSKTIIQNVATRSVALRRGYRMPNMTAKAGAGVRCLADPTGPQLDA